MFLGAALEPRCFGHLVFFMNVTLGIGPDQGIYHAIPATYNSQYTQSISDTKLISCFSQEKENSIFPCWSRDPGCINHGCYVSVCGSVRIAKSVHSPVGVVLSCAPFLWSPAVPEGRDTVKYDPSARSNLPSWVIFRRQLYFSLFLRRFINHVMPLITWQEINVESRW
jgi:hypothetical protein